MEEVERQVTETLHEFCAFVDEGRIDDLVALFCVEGCFDPGRPFRGHDQIRKLAAMLLNSWTASSHHITNVRVQVSGESEAFAVCSVYAWHQRLDGTQYESWGRYVDTLRREAGRWRFADRKVQMAGHRGIGDQGVPPVPRAAGPFA